MRVLCVGTDYPPAGRGGYEQQAADAVAHLRARGDVVRVLAGAHPPCLGDEDVHRELPRFPARPVPVTPAAAQAAERRSAAVLRRHLDAFTPDVVCWWRLAELSMSLVAQVRERGLPAVGVVCDAWMHDGPERDPWTRTTGAAPSWSGVRWLCCSPWLRDRLGLWDAGLAQPGVDPALFPPRAAAPPWRGRLIYAGRRSPLKGGQDARAALDHLPTEVTLRLVGDGGPPSHPRAHAEPALPRAALGARLRDADALLFPARWDEPWGLVPLEAMSSGVPVVTTATGGAAAYLRDGDNCLVVPRRDPRAIAAAVRRLASDPALRAQLTEGGRRTAAAHPAGAADRAVEAALLEAVGARRAA